MLPVEGDPHCSTHSSHHNCKGSGCDRKRYMSCTVDKTKQIVTNLANATLIMIQQPWINTDNIILPSYPN